MCPTSRVAGGTDCAVSPLTSRKKSTDDRVKDRLGGWRRSDTRKYVYQDRLSFAIRTQAALVRRHMRLGPPATECVDFGWGGSAVESHQDRLDVYGSQCAPCHAITGATNGTRNTANRLRSGYANRDHTRHRNRDRNRDQRTNADRTLAIGVQNTLGNNDLSSDTQSGRPDSNRRRPAWEAGILPTELRPRPTRNVRPPPGRG